MNIPKLSIIIPVINEAETLPVLFATLAVQREIGFEVVLSDGGSTDGTVEQARRLATESPFPSTVVSGERGRWKQLNTGASTAQGDILLFLHADSSFTDPRALSQGVAALHEAIRVRGDDHVAGHFALRFLRRHATPSLAYTYYEYKARLDRSGCIHGDQGFLLRRTFFQSVGPFDPSLPLLEDTRLAEKIRQVGEWILLPAEIWTSARRFETEGLYERQVLNALLMNCAAIGWGTFFREAPGIYRRQDRTQRLHLLPFLAKIQELLRPLPWQKRLRLWSDTGGYVRANAWQLALAWDVRRNFRQGVALAEMTTPTLHTFDNWFDWLTDHAPGRLASTVLIWLWFHLTRWRLGLKRDNVLE
jgi:rSAM/selenodomain-associated transferase 2